MPLLGNRRRKKSRAFEILVIPHGDGGGTKSFKGSKLALWGGAMLVSIFLVVFLAFRYTPLGRLVGVKEEMPDSASVETERRIRAIAEEMAILKEYNQALRKALGERGENESTPPRIDDGKRENPQHVEPAAVSEDLHSPSPSFSSITTSARSAIGGEGLKTNFPLFTPVAGIITQGFEPQNKHLGIDFAAKEGTPIHAASAGYVVFAGWTYDFGNTLILSHASGYITVYKHCSSLLKSTGVQVKRGEVVCQVGGTGQTSKGPHLHFEVLKDGVPLDPAPLLLDSKIAL